MIDITTMVIFGFKMTKETEKRFRDLYEEKYLECMEDEFIHSLSTWDESDTYFGAIVKVFDTDSPFAYSLNDMNDLGIDISDRTYKKLVEYTKFLEEHNLINEPFELLFINKLS